MSVIRIPLILIGLMTWLWAALTPGFNGLDIIGMLAWVMVVALIVYWPRNEFPHTATNDRHNQ